MERIIYQDYGKKGSIDATLGMYRLSKAIEKDMILQGRDFKPHTYNNWIKDEMNPSNKTGFKNGIRMGEILHNNEPWLPSYGKTKGEDLARAIVFTLRNQGVYDWPNVRKCVEAMPSPFNQLSTIQYSPIDTNSEILVSTISEVKKATTLHQTREAASKLLGLLDKAIITQTEQERILKQKDLQVLQYATHMQDLSKENQILKKDLISQLKTEIDHLETMRPYITEAQDVKKLEKAIKLAKSRLLKLQNE